MARRRQNRGLNVSQRLEQRVSEGDYYEALQLYKTAFSRMKAQGKLDEAEELLVTGAIAMAREKELTAATELGLLIVESFEENGRTDDETRLSQLMRVVEAMPFGEELSEFLKRAIRWTRSSTQEAAYELRLAMARSALATGNPGEAARYFAISGRPDDYAELVQQWSLKGYRGERDLFLCRAVLHTLSVGRTDDAAKLFDACATHMSEVSDGADAQEVLESPLCHFTRFVVELCQIRDSGAPMSQDLVTAFGQLRDVYGPSLDRDPHLDEMLNRIGDVHFGIKPPQPGGLMGMIGQLMGGM